jgi:hypothetical protein
MAFFSRSDATLDDDGRMAMIILLLALLVVNGEAGQNAWCWISMTSGTAFCDYASYGVCVDANAYDEGICIMNADWKHKS